MDQPDFKKPGDNAYRRLLLAEFRGYGRGKDVVVFPDPIAVFVNETLVLLDGPTRMTAYLLASSSCPDEVLVLADRSPDFAAWDANDFSS